MAFFDPDKINLPEKDAQLAIELTNSLIDALQARLVPEIYWSDANAAVNQAKCITQAFIRRSLTFLQAGLAEHEANRSLIASVCARSNIENIAAYCNFVDTAVPLLIAGNIIAFKKLTYERTFATRDSNLLQTEGDDLKATNILTQIQKMESKTPGFVAQYDRLSEFVHPNGMGTVVHYMSFPHPGRALFHDNGRNPEWGIGSLFLSAFELRHMEASIKQLEEALAAIPSP